MNILCMECGEPLVVHSFMIPQERGVLCVYSFSEQDDTFSLTETEGSIYSHKAEQKRLKKSAERFGREMKAEQNRRVMELICGK